MKYVFVIVVVRSTHTVNNFVPQADVPLENEVGFSVQPRTGAVNLTQMA